MDLELGATFATSLTYHLPTYQETISEWNKIKLYSCIKLGGRRYEEEVVLLNGSVFTVKLCIEFFENMAL